MSEPTPLVTLSELLVLPASVSSKEASDAALLSAVVNPTREAYYADLVKWATTGFPKLFVLHSYELSPPVICSDGVSRPIREYVDFILPTPMKDNILAIQAALPGVHPSFAFVGNSMQIWVSKA